MTVPPGRILPPLNIPAPSPGVAPSMSIGTLPPPSVPAPGTPGTPSPADPSTVVGRISIRNEVRESLMTPEIRALLSKQATNQTLSSAEQTQLAQWEALVEAEYSRRVGTAVPSDVQQLLDKIAKGNQGGTGTGTGGGSSGGGRAGGGGGGRSAGSGARSAGGGGASAGGRPAAGGGAAAAGRGAALPTRQQATTRTNAAAGTTTTGTGQDQQSSRRMPYIEAVANRRAQQQGRNGATPEEVATLRAHVADLLKPEAAGGAGGNVRPGNANDQDAYNAMREVGLIAWATQYHNNPNSVADNEKAAFTQAGLIDPNGKLVSDPRLNGRLLNAAMQDPNHPINTWTRAWLGMVTADQNAPLALDVRREAGVGSAQGAAPGAPVAAAPVATAPGAAGAPVAAPPAIVTENAAEAARLGLPEGSIQTHPEQFGQGAGWVSPDGRLWSVRNGNLEAVTDPGREGIDPNRFPGQQNSIGPEGYQNYLQRRQQQAQAAAPTQPAGRRELNDSELWGDTGLAIARAAWAAQREQRPDSLSDMDQEQPTQDFLDTWRRWYAKERDLKQAPDLTALLQRAQGQPTTQLPVGPSQDVGPPPPYPTGQVPEATQLPTSEAILSAGQLFRQRLGALSPEEQLAYTATGQLRDDFDRTGEEEYLVDLAEHQQRLLDPTDFSDLTDRRRAERFGSNTDATYSNEGTFNGEPLDVTGSVTGSASGGETEYQSQEPTLANDVIDPMKLFEQPSDEGTGGMTPGEEISAPTEEERPEEEHPEEEHPEEEHPEEEHPEEEHPEEEHPEEEHPEEEEEPKEKKEKKHEDEDEEDDEDDGGDFSG